MIRTTIHISKYNWTVHCYFAVTGYYVTDIISRLKSLDCPKEFSSKAYRMICSGQIDSGLCYSNQKYRKSVVVTSVSHDASEFINSLSHEVSHVVQHICKEDGVDLDGEEPCYMMGDICQLLFKAWVKK